MRDKSKTSLLKAIIGATVISIASNCATVSPERQAYLNDLRTRITEIDLTKTSKAQRDFLDYCNDRNLTLREILSKREYKKSGYRELNLTEEDQQKALLYFYNTHLKFFNDSELKEFFSVAPLM